MKETRSKPWPITEGKTPNHTLNCTKIHTRAFLTRNVIFQVPLPEAVMLAGRGLILNLFENEFYGRPKSQWRGRGEIT